MNKSDIKLNRRSEFTRMILPENDGIQLQFSFTCMEPLGPKWLICHCLPQWWSFNQAFIGSRPSWFSSAQCTRSSTSSTSSTMQLSSACGYCVFLGGPHLHYHRQLPTWARAKTTIWSMPYVVSAAFWNTLRSRVFQIQSIGAISGRTARVKHQVQPCQAYAHHRPRVSATQIQLPTYISASWW